MSDHTYHDEETRRAYTIEAIWIEDDCWRWEVAHQGESVSYGNATSEQEAVRAGRYTAHRDAKRHKK